MAVATPLSLNNIVTEFGGTGDHALSEYYRGGGFIPSHSANLNIPGNSIAGLAISQFSGAELNFTATVTVGNNGGGLSLGQYGYENGAFGSISRDVVGITRLFTNTTPIIRLYEFGSFNGFFITYYLLLEFNGNVTFSTLGYHFFSSVTVNGTTFNRVDAASNPNGIYSGGATGWDWISGASSRGFPTSGSYGISLAFSGP